MTLKQANVVTCVVLAGLTLAVFAVEQSAGPESTVRRYLVAVQKGDAGAMQRLITTPVGARPNLWLVAQSQQVANSPMRAKGKERSGNLVLVATDHETTVLTPRGEERMVVTIFWVLVRSNSVWQIDPIRTYEYREQSTGFQR